MLAFPSPASPSSSLPPTHPTSCSLKKQNPPNQNKQINSATRWGGGRANKKAHKTMSPLCVANYSWAWGLLWSMIDIQWHSVGEKWFPFPSKHQSPLTSWLKVGLLVHFLLSVLGILLAWTCVGFVHAVTVSVSLYVHLSCFLWKTTFLGVIHSLMEESWNMSLLLLLLDFLNPEQKDLMKTSHIRLRLPKSQSLNIAQRRGTLCYFLSTTRCFYKNAQAKQWSMGIREWN